MPFEKVQKISQLKRGDIIRPVSGNGESLLIDAVEIEKAIAVYTIEINDPTEWEVLREERRERR